MSLEFRMMTPREEAARKRRMDNCDHLAHADHRTITYRSGYSDISNAYHDHRTGTIVVRCRGCGGDWVAASVTKLGAEHFARALRDNCRTARGIDSETKDKWRRWAQAWDAIAKERAA